MNAILKLLYGRKKFSDGQVCLAYIEQYYDTKTGVIWYRKAANPVNVTIQSSRLTLFGWHYSIHEAQNIVISQKLMRAIA